MKIRLMKTYMLFISLLVISACGGGNNNGQGQNNNVNFNQFVIDEINNTSDVADAVEINGLDFVFDNRSPAAFDALLN